MSKLLKVLAWLIGIVALVVLGAVLFVSVFFDPNDYKEDIAALVEKHTGRQLAIDGEIKLGFFPWLSVRADNVTLSNPPGFDSDDMLAVKQLGVSVKLLPLLSGEFEADTIVLTEPVVRLMINENGVSNWQDLTGEPSQSPAEPAGAVGALAVEGVSLSNGTFIWQDRQTQASHVLEGVELSTGEITAGRPTNVNLALTYRATGVAEPVSLELDSRVEFDAQNSRVRLDQTSVRGSYGGLAELSATPSEVLIDAGASTAAINGLHLEAKLSQEVTGSEQSTRVVLDADISADMQAGRILLSGLQGSAELPQIDEIAVSLAEASYDTAKSALVAPEFEVNAKLDPGLLGLQSGELTLSLVADLGADFEQGVVQLAGLSGHAKHAVLGTGNLQIAGLNIDLTEQTLQTPALVLDAKLASSLLGTASTDDAIVSLAMALSADMGANTLLLSGVSGKARHSELGDAGLDVDALRIDLSSLVVDAPGVNLSAQLTATTLGLEGDDNATMSLVANVKAELERNMLQISGVEGSLRHAELGDARVEAPGMEYDTASLQMDAPRVELSAKLAPATLGLGSTRPVDLSIGAAVNADWAANRVRLSDIVGRAEHPEIGQPDLSMNGLVYDLANSVLDASGLQARLDYLAPGEKTPVEASLSGDLKADLTRGLVTAAQTDITTAFGPGAGSVHIAQLDYDMSSAQLKIDGVKIAGNYNDPAGTSPISTELTAKIEANPVQGNWLMFDVQGKAGGAELGEFDVSLARLEYAAPRSLVSAEGLEIGGGLLEYEVDAAVNELSMNTAEQTLAIPAVVIRVDDVPISVDVGVDQLFGDVTYRGSLRTEAFSPRTFIEKLGTGFTSQDPEALGHARLSSGFQGTMAGVRLDDIDGELDDTKLSGYVQLQGFDRPAYEFDVDIDSLDLDRYTPAQTDGVETGAALIVLPVGLFRELDANGRLHVGQLKVSGASLTNIEVGVVSTAQGMTVKPMNAELYDGTLEGEMNFASEEARSVLRLQQAMKDIEMGPLLTDTDVTDRLTGKGRLNLDVEGVEAAGEPKTRGVAAFRFFDGAVKGLDLRKLYMQARQIYNEKKGREQEVATDDSEEFRFTEMTGTISFDERTAVNDDLQIKSPLFRITGRGKADLAANQLDYRISATVVESAKGQGGEDLSELKGVTIPIRVSGDLQAPVYSLDVEELLKQALQRQVEKETKKLEEKIQEKLGNELQKLLKIN